METFLILLVIFLVDFLVLAGVWYFNKWLARRFPVLATQGGTIARIFVSGLVIFVLIPTILFVL